MEEVSKKAGSGLIYGRTELGRKMLPIIDALAAFGSYYRSVVEEEYMREEKRPHESRIL